jgi:hypothetical protein
MEVKFMRHLNPVWGERANFILGASCSRFSTEEPQIREQLWGRKISEYKFEICCIPFFVYDVSLGDEVVTNKDYWITEVVKRSGYFTYRVWFGNIPDTTIRDNVIEKANYWNCLFEWYSGNLLAIAAPSLNSAHLMADFLDEKQQSGYLVYESGQT